MTTTNVKIIEAQYIPMLGYAEAWDMQKAYVKQIDKEERPQTLLLLQHPPTYTIGSQKHPEHLLYSEEELAERGIEVFQIDRGGDITYHGPGQLVGYPLLYLDGIGLDLHGYLRQLEQVIIDWLADYGIEGGRKSEYTGVWVGDEKIAAIGVKFNKAMTRRGFVTSHGFALNVKSGIAQDGFRGIIPCGIQDYSVTSFADLTGNHLTTQQVAKELMPHFCRQFGFENTDVKELFEYPANADE
ncbi:octanoyltransferase [Paenibacillus baekrokdamisoli]|uniref:Octanoyltransferase n=1 Tax=Paenibacillus baekrokdamisoli TaxID=1712516 RepID=A0A3G9JCX8_9BACL|nr:lipoyl(octanoyl) transferase LipB [Paenibacillus baekrokdamisoli]MBB3069569.1 lipoyl(octanoyl) transferase [Paenibacillus baekrokdamisoli]BBH21074.1 octanoyltransferase [Paenibacillus baekrokdamisoli]